MRPVILIFLVSQIAAAGCSEIQSDWGFGEVQQLYEQNELDKAEAVIVQNGRGFGDYHFFPHSINILIRKGIETSDKKYFDQAAESILQLKAESKDYFYDAYGELTAHLRDNGLRPTFSRTTIARCDERIELLRDMNETAAQGRFGIADVEGAYWYSLVVNASCTTAESRAVLISMLSNIKFSESQELLVATNRTFPLESVEQRQQLCAMRRLYNAYASSGLRKLVDSGAVVCDTPYRGYMDELAPGPPKVERVQD